MQGAEFEVQGAGFRVQGAGCRVLACIPLAVMAMRNEELFGPSSGMLTHPGRGLRI